MLFEQCRGTCIGGVHVKPKVVAAGYRADVGDGVDAGCGRRAHRRNHAERDVSAGEISFDKRGERFGTHAELVIGRNMANVIETNACGQSAAIDRRMRMLGGIEDQGRMLASFACLGGCRFSRGKNRVQAAGGSSVVDNPEKIVR